MWNKLYIIIDKKSVKQILIWKFSGSDIAIMVVAFCVGYFPCQILFNELVGMVLGAGLFITVGFLLIELRNHLSILQHVQMWYKYRYQTPHEYFYIPETEIIKVEENEKSEEALEWEEYQDMVNRNKFKAYNE